MKVIPNIISIFRICLVPVFVTAYFIDERDIKVYAILVYALASLSDFLDGFLARKYKAASNLGKFLDPLGDKLMTFAVILCITIDRGGLLVLAVVVLGVKETCMGIGGFVIHKAAHAELPPSNILGKISTVVFFMVCITVMLFKIPDTVVISLISGAILLTLLALVSYIKTYATVMRNRSVVGREDGPTAQ